MKKLISLLTVLMLSLQMTTVFAADATMTFDSVTGAPGETVDVNVVLADCAPITSLGFEISYDTTALELVGAVAAGATLSPSYDTMPYQAQWNATGDVDRNGTIATLTFKIKDDAAAGEYDIDATWSMASEGWYNDEVNYDSNYDEIIIDFVDGAITVEAPAPAGPTLDAAKDGNSVSITATGVEVGGKFIVAGYDADGLVDVEVIDAAATATASVDGDTVKVMWWDSVDGMTSIAPAVEL